MNGVSQLFTRSEVAKYDGKEGRAPYTILHNRVFNLTNWLDTHPGGPDVLLQEAAGKDATDHFEDIEHSVDARRKRMDFYIGDLVPEEHKVWVRRKHAVKGQSGAGTITRLWFDYSYNEHQGKPLELKLREVWQEAGITEDEFKNGLLCIYPHTPSDGNEKLDIHTAFCENHFPLQVSFRPSPSSAGTMGSMASKMVLGAVLALYIRTAINGKPLPAATYSRALRHMHFSMGIGVVSGIWSAQAASSTNDGEQKKNYMLIHKSSGVLMLFAIFARIWLRLKSAIPPSFPGPKNQQLLERAIHKVLYLILLLLPLSGATFGYFSGTGVPFLMQGKADPCQDVANQAIGFHVKLGQLLKYILVPYHFGISAYHSSNGHSIIRRISPFV